MGGSLYVNAFVPAASDEAQRSLNAAGHEPTKTRESPTGRFRDILSILGRCHPFRLEETQETEDNLKESTESGLGQV
jgi:hypothetical protein